MIAIDDSFAVSELYAGELPTGAHLTWLQTQRSKAQMYYAQVGLPGVKDEEWRYTNLRQLKDTPFTAAATKTQPSIDLAAADHPRLVFVDGVYSPSLSSLDGLGDAKVMNMAAALEQHASELEPYLGQSLPDQDEQHGFTALNTAYFKDGYVILLPKNKVIKEPVEMLYVAGDHKEQAMYHSRNVVVLEANSQCTIVERFVAKQGLVYLHNVITEIFAADNAHCDHYKIQQESDDAFHVGAVYINQGNSAQVSTHNVTLTGLVTRNDIVSNLLGQGSHIEMNGLVVGHGRQHIDSFTQVNHLVPNTTSDEYYKTILDDHSRSIFRGRIVVAQDAQKTNADQQNNNLLLSDSAEADSKPQLEIYADDVQCSHGCTVGQLDPKSIFYLNSRGLDNESARALLTFAFANQVIERVKVESVRDELTRLIAGELLHGLQDLV